MSAPDAGRFTVEWAAEDSDPSAPDTAVGSWARGGPPEVGRSGAGHHADDHGADRNPDISGEAAVPHLPASPAPQATLDLIDGALSDWSDDIGRDAMRWRPPETITLSPPSSNPDDELGGPDDEPIWGCGCQTCREPIWGCGCQTCRAFYRRVGRMDQVASIERPTDWVLPLEADTSYAMDVDLDFGVRFAMVGYDGAWVDITPYLLPPAPGALLRARAAWPEDDVTPFGSDSPRRIMASRTVEIQFTRPRWSVIEEVFAGAFTEVARIGARRRRLAAMRGAYRARRR